MKFHSFHIGMVYWI